MNRLVLAPLVIAALVAPAVAEDTFEQKAAGARKVAHLDEIVWSLFATCTQGDDTQQRQCRQVRDARAKTELGSTLLVEADPDAFELGAYSAAKKSMTLLLSSCIRCAGMQLEGKPFHVAGATPRIDGGKLRTAALYDTARQFPDEAAAQAYRQAIAGARVEMVIKLADRKKWTVSGKDGLAVEVLAWRVVVPCTGTVVISSSPSGNADPDKTACPAATPPAK